MSIQEPRRIDRRTAEHLLGGAPMDVHDGHPPLAAFLAAAAAPGRPDELAREQATLAAFRAAQLAPIPAHRSLSAVRTAVMKVLTIKAAVVLAATTAGGVALAAGTGTLPTPLTLHAPTSSSGFSAAHPMATQSLKGPNPANTSNSKGPKVPDASKAPSPSLVGLCLAYHAGIDDKNDMDKKDQVNNDRFNNDWARNSRAKNEKAKRDKVLGNPAFAVLITAAGGKDKVDRFCLALLATPVPTSSGAQRGAKPDEDRHGGQNGRNQDDLNNTGGNHTTVRPNPER
jgi:hypothetical protein